MISTIATVKQIYPEHVLIQFELPHYQPIGQELALNQVDLNQLCMSPVKQWAIETIELEVNSAFPCLCQGSENSEFISKLVNGFVLKIANTRIVFIPSDAIDLAEFEVPQEWVDLPNWAASYYVPIRVDLEHQYLHLWGFISHADLKDRAQLDRIFRNYHVAAGDTVANLHLLQDRCELQALDPAIFTQSALKPLDTFSPVDAEGLIQQLHQRNSRFSPRLDLPFTQWGAILNEPQWLGQYLNPETDLSIWWESTKLAICDGWESIGNFINPPQAIPALNLAKKLPSLQTVKGVSLGSDREIKAAITQLYQHQTELPLPENPIGIDDLIPLLKYCQTAKIWWKAAEYLWTIKPDHLFLITRIRKLETHFGGHSIVLMISMIPTLDGQIAVLVRLYPAAPGSYLPPGLQLTIQDDLGANLLTDPHGDPYIATAREDVKDSCIQLYFVADLADRFIACITLDDVKATKTFKLQQSPSQ